MKELSDELKDSIKKNLPHMVGEELQQVLSDYEKIKKEHKDMILEFESLEEELSKIKKLNRKYDDLIDLEKVLDGKEINLKIKEEILKIREEHAKERVNEIKNLTQTVFGSNRINYDLSLATSTYNAGNNNTSGNLTGIVTKKD